MRDAGTEHINLELMRAIGAKEFFHVIEREDFWRFMRELKASGRAKHIGFSRHGKVDDLDRLLSEHAEVEIAQIQANYFDRFTGSRYANGGEYETCRRHDKQMVVMEPVKGGSLARANRHPKIRSLFDKADSSQTPLSWALRYAASLDGVVTVLSGMSSLAQMEENGRAMLDRYKPLTDGDRAMLKKAAVIVRLV